MIKTIFFDIGGVLIDINFRKTSQYISDCTDLSVNQIENSFPREEHNKYEKGLLSNHEWFLAYKESLPQPCCLKESDFWRSWKILLGKETLLSFLNGFFLVIAHIIFFKLNLFFASFDIFK